MEDLGATRELKVMRAEKRCFNINQKAYPGDPWQIVTQVDTTFGCKTITLKSVVEVRITHHRVLMYTHSLPI